MNKAIRCLDCGMCIIFVPHKTHTEVMSPEGSVVSYSKITKKYVGLCPSCASKMKRK